MRCTLSLVLMIFVFVMVVLLVSPNVQLYIMDSMEAPAMLDAEYQVKLERFDPRFDGVNHVWGNAHRDGPCKTMPLEAVWINGRIRLLNTNDDNNS